MADLVTVEEDIMTDTELCNLLRISVITMRKYLRQGVPTGRHTDAGDIRKIRHFTVGGQRRWVKASVDEFVHGKE